MSHATARPLGATGREESHSARRDTARLWTVVFCLLFLLEGLIFIPYIGLQTDELLFGGAIYPPWNVSHLVRAGGHTFPTMILTYIGTLKSWLYRLLVFTVWPPSPWSVRLPVLLLGVASLWIFSELVLRSAGARVAIVAVALLATDATYVLTTCFDWGPVALQHLLLLAGTFAVWWFYRSGNRLALAIGFFAFGLGLWDKALFVWSLAGLAAGAAVAFPRATLSTLRLRNLAVAALALSLGAAPLLLYNHDTGMRTFRDNARLSTTRFNYKVEVLRNTLEGSALFGYLVPEGAALAAATPANPGEEISLALSEATGQRRSGWLALASILAFALLPWMWGSPARRPMLFAAVFMAVTWIQMALSQNGGTGAHHVVLLWPFPHLFVAVALAQASRFFRRAGVPVLVVVTALICGSNLLILNEYLAQVIENGNTTLWTDAVSPLDEALEATPARHVYVMDSGMFDVLRALSRGALPLEDGPDVFLRDTEKKLPPEMLARKDAIFLGHTEGNEINTGTAARLEALGQSVGLRKQAVRVVNDRMGRPVFELYRFERR